MKTVYWLASGDPLRGIGTDTIFFSLGWREIGKYSQPMGGLGTNEISRTLLTNRKPATLTRFMLSAI
jgi:hypothetical protein